MNRLRIKQIGQIEYAASLVQQKQFTDQRSTHTADQIWCLEHNPVYTLGLSANREHILKQNDIPVIQTDRGGQVTYHGPGQLVVYLLLDLKRLGLPVKKYVYSLEQAIINMLDSLNIQALRKSAAPGVYVEGKKIAALGIRIRRGCCYHGISLNVDMDLSPFNGINPCGFPKLPVTQLKDFKHQLDVTDAALKLIPHLTSELGYEKYLMDNDSQAANPHKNKMNPNLLQIS